MKRLIKFGSISQFNSVAKDISHVSRYDGLDENKSPIYSCSLIPPILDVVGTEKIHGTNLTVCFNNLDGIWFQSKERIITPNSDNGGAAKFCEERKEVLIGLIQKLSLEHRINLNSNTIVLAGEFAGEGIVKKSAVSGIKKQFFIFQHFKLTSIEQSESSLNTFWIETKFENSWIDSKKDGIYNLMNFPTYHLKIDFNNPLLSHELMLNFLNDIELNSPVGNYFGKDGNIAEGIVFSTEYKGKVFKWKVKGDKHSKSKVKKLPKVDNVQEQLKIDVTNIVTPAWRLEQMFDLANDTINGGIPNIKNIKLFLDMVFNDILKEEKEVFETHYLSINNINSKIALICRNWYLNQIRNN